MLEASAARQASPTNRAGETTRATVVIVSYNCGEDLARCLDSLRGGARSIEAGTGHEIVVVDNASTDGSAEAVALAFPTVRLVRSSENLGFGGGCNLGAALARGEHLVFLNPDTVVGDGWLEALTFALDDDPSVGLATSKVLLLRDPERVNACGNDVHLTGIATCRGLGARPDEYDEPADVGAVSGAAFAVRRQLFDLLGGFDADFFLYVEDTDLSLRARLAGYRCVYVPSSVVYHDYSLRFGPNKTYYQERNRYAMLLKCLRWRTLVVLLPALLMGELVTWGFVLLREPRRAGNKVQAYASTLRNQRRIAAKRAEAQRLRRVGDREILRALSARLPCEQAGSGIVPRLARLALDPLFFALRGVAFGLVWW